MKIWLLLLFVIYTNINLAFANDWLIESESTQNFNIKSDYAIAKGTTANKVSVEWYLVNEALRKGLDVYLYNAVIDGGFSLRSGSIHSIILKNVDLIGTFWISSATLNSLVLENVRSQDSIMGHKASVERLVIEKSKFDYISFQLSQINSTYISEVVTTRSYNADVSKLGRVHIDNSRFLSNTDFSRSVIDSLVINNSYLGGLSLYNSQIRNKIDLRSNLYNAAKDSIVFTGSSLPEDIRVEWSDKNVYYLYPLNTVIPAKYHYVFNARQPTYNNDLNNWLGNNGFNVSYLNENKPSKYKHYKNSWYYDGYLIVKDKNKYSACVLFHESISSGLYYDQIFLNRLHQIYKRQGHHNWANSIYYTLKVHDRNKNKNYKRWLEYLFLDLTFGYGVKPSYYVVSFLFFLILYQLIYTSRIGIVVNSNKMSIQDFRKKWFERYILSTVHSFNIMTPGIDLGSRELIKNRGYIMHGNDMKLYLAEFIQKLIGWYYLALFLIMFNNLWIG